MKTLLPLFFVLAVFTACNNSTGLGTTAQVVETQEIQIDSLDINLSPEAQKGKAAFAICLVCHNTDLDSMLGPPMRNIQRRYKISYPEKTVFVEKIVEHTKNPTEENSLMKMAVKTFGVMPALPLSDEYLGNIGAYIYEGIFPFPCKHMKAEIAADPDSDHAKMMQKFVDENCE